MRRSAGDLNRGDSRRRKLTDIEGTSLKNKILDFMMLDSVWRDGCSWLRIA